MATVQDLVERALQKLLCEEDVGNFSAEQLDHAFVAGQDMLDSWSLDPFKQFQMVQTSFNTANATASYTIGAAQTWNTSQPIEIDSGMIRVGGDDFFVEAVKRRDYNKIQNKTLAGRPTKLYFQRGASTGVVFLHPVPTATEAIYLDMRKALATFSAIDDTVLLPLGYQRAFVANLAIELAPDYEITPSELLLKQAAESLAAITTINAPFTQAGFKGAPQDRGMAINSEKG